MRPLHRGARWAWGARGLPQEVRRPLHRSIWVRRERLELSAEVSAAVSALGSGAPVPEPSRIGPTGRRGRERAPRGWGTRGVCSGGQLALKPAAACAQIVVFCHTASRAESLSAGGSYLPGATGALGTAETSPLSV